MTGSVAHDPQGRDVTSPLDLPARAWREILGRVWDKTASDNISLLAAGVAFFVFLALVPLLGAVVMTYGLIADPSTIADHVRLVIRLVPRDAAKLIIDQIISIVTTGTTPKGIGLVVSLVVALYSASRASTALIEALNIIYEQPERRGFLKTSLLALLLIAGAMVMAVIGLLGASALTLFGKLVKNLGPIGGIAVSFGTWALATALASAGIAAAYRYAPDRHNAQWRWLTLGSLVATLLWLFATIVFGLYARTLGHYNATYGSLSAVVVLLLWLWVSAYVILLGAELDAEAERQTARDTTTGPEKPLGSRGATVADEVAGVTSEGRAMDLGRRAS